MPPRLVFYISGHGLGHASRVIEVINALHARRPDIAMAARTAAPRWLFDWALRAPVELAEVECDAGVVQLDSLRPDEGATLRRAMTFQRGFSDAVARESAYLRRTEASLVVGDIPPLAFSAAAGAGLPSAALGNFTWDWIYAAYAEGRPLNDAWLASIRHAYSHAGAAWRLPLCGGFDSFRCAVEDVPLIARRSRRARREVRAALGLPAEPPVVLVSFGGYGLAGLPLAAAAAGGRYTVVVTNRPDRAAHDCRARVLARGVYELDERALHGAGYRYEDLVAAADVVATKPGFGIIAECIANDAAILYTSRGRFAEYDVLVREMPRLVRCEFIDPTDLFAGRWAPHLDTLLSAPRPPGAVPVNGADVIADRLASMV